MVVEMEAAVEGVKKEDKKKRKPTLRIEDLPTRLAQSAAGKDYLEVCMDRVFSRIKFESMHIRRPSIPDADISKSLPRMLADNLNRMGITQLLPTQRYTLPLMVDHDADLFVEAATGHGKTLSFLIPVAVALLRDLGASSPSSAGRPSALVIANTQVLQLQTYNVAKSLLLGTGLRAGLAVGETSIAEHKKELAQGVDILIATTGRLAHFLEEKVISLFNLKYYIYDEADKMIRNDVFIQDLAKIEAFIPAHIKPNLRSCFFTATFGNMTEFHVNFRPEKACTVRLPGNPLITHQIIPLDKKTDNDFAKCCIVRRLLEKDLIAQGRSLNDKSDRAYSQKAVIFVGKKERSTYLAANLRMYGFAAGAVNGSFSLKQRNEVVQKFCDGVYQVLVATDSMARGHDIPYVTHVINYDYSDITSFKHRAGRTARIGHKGTCTTLLSREQFLLFDHPGISELEPRRKEAAALAGYLLLDCGQRLPRCLMQSVKTAVVNRLADWHAAGIDNRKACDNWQGIEAELRAQQEEMKLLQQGQHTINRTQPTMQVLEIDENGQIWTAATNSEEDDDLDSKDSDGEYNETEYFNGMNLDLTDDEEESDHDSVEEMDVSREYASPGPEATPGSLKWSDDEDEMDEAKQQALFDEMNARNVRQQQLEQKQAIEDEIARLAAVLDHHRHLQENGEERKIEDEEQQALINTLAALVYQKQQLECGDEEKEGGGEGKGEKGGEGEEEVEATPEIDPAIYQENLAAMMTDFYRQLRENGKVDGDEDEKIMRAPRENGRVDGDEDEEDDDAIERAIREDVRGGRGVDAEKKWEEGGNMLDDVEEQPIDYGDRLECSDDEEAGEKMEKNGRPDSV